MQWTLFSTQNRSQIVCFVRARALCVWTDHVALKSTMTSLPITSHPPSPFAGNLVHPETENDNYLWKLHKFICYHKIPHCLKAGHHVRNEETVRGLTRNQSHGSRHIQGRMIMCSRPTHAYFKEWLKPCSITVFYNDFSDRANTIQ